MNSQTLRPSYLVPRLRQHRFQKRHPLAPWLTENAIYILDNWIRPGDHGFEWGSGRSTVWFASRVSHLVSVEHHRGWHEQVTDQLEQAGLADRVDYRHVDCDLVGTDEPSRHPYADAIDSVEDGSLDFALVDGVIRLSCMSRAIDKIRPGGLLILDNANRYLSNAFDGSFTTVVLQRGEPLSPGWAAMAERLRDWRWMNTSDGIWDTRFWVRTGS